MFRLAKLGVLPSIFIDLKDDVLLCASCMLGTENRRQCRTKRKKSGSIKKENKHNLGAGVSVDQL